MSYLGRVGLWGVKPNFVHQGSFLPPNKSETLKQTIRTWTLCEGPCCFFLSIHQEMQRSFAFSLTNPASSACNMSCRRLEEDKPLSVPSSRVTGSLQSRRSAPGSLACAMLHCSGQQRFDSSFQMAAGPDVNQVYGKCCLRDCCRACAADPLFARMLGLPFEGK